MHGNSRSRSFRWNLQAKSSSKTIVNKHKDAEDKDGGVIDLKKLRDKQINEQVKKKDLWGKEHKRTEAKQVRATKKRRSWGEKAPTTIQICKG